MILILENTQNVSNLCTILTGVAVFVVSQLVLEIFIRPFKEYKKIKAEVSFLLEYYANIYRNPCNEVGKTDVRYEEAEKMFREVASKLIYYKSLFFYPHKNIGNAVSALIGLSNGLTCGKYDKEDTLEENKKLVNSIKESLNLKS